MAKEMMIVFVYDTARCRAEEDDPAEAVIYFHPGWVSDTQRHALCGQLIGTAQCAAALFSPPTAISLKSGKFVLREYKQYILAIGSDRNIPDWMLKNRAELLTSIIKVYHGDLNKIASQFPGENNPRFAEKLYQMLETYLPILQYGCHIFQRVPMLSLPKSATYTYLESMQILQHCQKTNGVLGGIILYNNKIVATQLSPKLTSHLAVVDPYRIKSPAEVVETVCPVPLGAQLLVVYVGKKDYEELKEEMRRCKLLTEGDEGRIEAFRKTAEEKLKDCGMQSTMKRDKSLLFTAVPEEDVNLISPPSTSLSPTNIELNNEHYNTKKSSPAMPDVIPFNNKPRIRPNKLSLSFKHTAEIDIEEMGPKNMEKVFVGQTSVCSTPMLEIKRLHGNIMSICQNADNASSQPDVLKATADEENAEASEMNNITKRTNENFVQKPQNGIKKLASVSDIQASMKKFSERASIRFGLRKSKVDGKDIASPTSASAISNNNFCVTITDPSYPVFRNDGLPISQSLFNEYVRTCIAENSSDDSTVRDNIFSHNRQIFQQQQIEDFDSDMYSSPVKKPTVKHNDIEMADVKKFDFNNRKSLALPLKSLSVTPSVKEVFPDIGGHHKLEAGRKYTGVQLTPLMEKLSHLAFSEKSSGYSSKAATPTEYKDFWTKTITQNESVDSTSKLNKSNCNSEDDLDILSEYSSHSVRCALFICGLQNMAIMVLMEMDTAHNADAIQSLWDTAINTLGSIEQQCMEPLLSSSESTEYSFLALDPNWGTIKKGGPWPPADIATMGFIHNEFKEHSELSELILRSEDSVVMGTSCGGFEVYYSETGARGSIGGGGGATTGIPGPADVMATALLKARRRLQRDHSVVIL